MPLDGSPFHDWFDYNGVAFSIELRAWGRTFSDFHGKIGLHIYGYLWLANVQECLYCRWNVNCSSFNLKNGSIHFRIIFRIRLRNINRKWLRWDRQNYFCPKVTKMGSEIRHTIDSNVVFPAAVFWMWRLRDIQKTAARETNYIGLGAKIHPSPPGFSTHSCLFFLYFCLEKEFPTAPKISKLSFTQYKLVREESSNIEVEFYLNSARKRMKRRLLC